MNIIKKYETFLQSAIYFVETIAYTISFIIITLSIFRSIFIYISEYNQPIKAFVDTRLNLGESVALALSFILGVEVLKLFYIKSYKQLIIVICLVLIKLLVGYFLSKEIYSNIKERTI